MGPCLQSLYISSTVVLFVVVAHKGPYFSRIVGCSPVTKVAPVGHQVGLLAHPLQAYLRHSLGTSTC